MDAVSANLTAAWLQAVSRIQAQGTVDPAQRQPPQTMTDVMEQTLRNAAPQSMPIDGAGAVLNRLV
jgi:hypothetical protein